VARRRPGDEVLASSLGDQRARDLRAAGVPGSLCELRVRAYLDLLQERDSRAILADPGQGQSPADPDGPGGRSDGSDGRPGGPGGNSRPGNGPGGTGKAPSRPGSGCAGPSLAALVNITVPLATVLGESGTPGEAAGFGLLDASTARDLITATGKDPRTRWCVTALHPDGTAAAKAA
jgi:hypothetical protein